MSVYLIGNLFAGCYKKNMSPQEMLTWTQKGIIVLNKSATKKSQNYFNTFVCI